METEGQECARPWAVLGSVFPSMYQTRTFMPVSLLLALAILPACQTASVRPAPDTAKAPEKNQPVPTQSAVNQPPLTNTPPRYRVGDQWQWSDGYGLKVTQVNGDIATMQRTDAPDQWQKRQTLFKIESQSQDVHRQRIYTDRDPAQLFPLESGKTVVFRREYLANKQLRTHRTSWRVDGRERITVPAGTFLCWILSRRSRSLGSEWTSYERWWYCPQIKNYARLEYQYGEQASGSRVLMTYKLSMPER